MQFAISPEIDLADFTRTLAEGGYLIDGRLDGGTVHIRHQTRIGPTCADPDCTLAATVRAGSASWCARHGLAVLRQREDRP